MLQIKEWLESNVGIPVANTAFKDPVNFPFIVFIEEDYAGGADLNNVTCDRNISIELYSSKILNKYEKLIESLLNERGFEYTKSRDWVESERCFETIYDFNFLERMEE